MTTQDRIKRYLQSGRSLTTLQCLNLFRTYKLAEYVRRFRREGMNIKTTRVQAKNKWYGKYILQP